MRIQILELEAKNFYQLKCFSKLIKMLQQESKLGFANNFFSSGFYQHLFHNFWVVRILYTLGAYKVDFGSGL